MGFTTLQALAGEAGITDKQLRAHRGSGKIQADGSRVSREEGERWLALYRRDSDFYEIICRDGKIWLSPKLAVAYHPLGQAYPAGQKRSCTAQSGGATSWVEGRATLSRSRSSPF